MFGVLMVPGLHLIYYAVLSDQLLEYFYQDGAALHLPEDVEPTRGAFSCAEPGGYSGGMKSWRIQLVLLALAAAVWVWINYALSFSADQMFWRDTPLQSAWVGIPVVVAYVLLLPGAAIVLAVLLLSQLRKPPPNRIQPATARIPL